MKIMRTLMVAASLLASTAAILPVAAQAQTAAPVSYTPGTVWQTSNIEIVPGQFHNYMDYLKNEWKPQMEWLKAEGWVISYHVMEVQDRRDGEPSLILVQQWRENPTAAQGEELTNRWMASRRTDRRAQTTAGAERRVMRIPRGSMELRELNLR